MKQLTEYNKKRNFRLTSEPKAKIKKAKSKKLIFVVQEHHASHLHYDFRLEMEGVLRSWAVPKGVPMEVGERRLAVEVEDHPIKYAKFHGHIPEGQYGGGDVYIWDNGTWECEGDPVKAFHKGKIEFTLKGKKLKGDWILVRTKTGTRQPNWLLMKRSKKKAKVTTEIEVAPKKRELLKKDPIKNFIEPELARLVEEPPEGKDWIYETKFDGYRIQAHIQGGRVTLITRRKQNWTERYPTIANALDDFDHDIILDGEVVWLEKNGASNFQKLQNSMQTDGNSSAIKYYVFDLLQMDGQDVRSLPLVERKKLLKQIVRKLKNKAIKFSEDFDVDGERFLQAACDIQLEGVMAKRADSSYESGRHDDWVKLKCKLRQEFVIGGFTDPQGARLEFGALLLGVYENGKFRYVGKCGTGFNNASLRELKKKLSKYEDDTSPFQIGRPREKGTHWLRPALVAEVKFANWTDDKILRVPVFQGLREDKDPKKVRIENAKHKSSSDHTS